MEEQEFKVIEEAGTVRDIRANGGTIKPSESTYDRNGEEKHRYQVRYRNPKTALWATVVAFESSKFESDAARREAKLCLCDYGDGRNPVWVLCAPEKFGDDDGRFGSADDEE